MVVAHNAGEIFHLQRPRRPVDGRHMLHNAAQNLLRLLSHLRRQGADRTGHHHLIGDDIEPLASIDSSESHHQGI